MINLNIEKALQRLLNSLQGISSETTVSSIDTKLPDNLTVSSNRLLVDANITSTVVSDRNKYTAYGNLATAEKRVIFSINAGSQLTETNNRTILTGSATLTQNNGELELNTAANGASSVIVESVHPVLYVPGTTSEWSFGCRFTSAPTGNQEFRGGSYDGENGFHIALDATGWKIVIQKRNRSEPVASAQTTTTILQANFNVDRLDGTGASTINLADYITTGMVFICEYTYYGYGEIRFYVRVADPILGEQRILFHRHQPVGGTMTADPNVPLRVEFLNGGTATARTVYVSGREYATYGEPRYLTRPVSVARTAVTNNNGLRFPAIAIRRKAFFNGRLNHILVVPRNLFLSSTNRTNRIELWIDNAGSVSGGSWTNIPNYPATYSCLESNITATTTYTPSANAIRIFDTVAVQDIVNITEVGHNLSAQIDSLPRNKELILSITALDGASNTEIVDLSLEEFH